MDNANFVLYCDMYERSGRPVEMVPWINTAFVDNVNISAQAYKKAQRGDLQDAALEVELITRKNINIQKIY